jgi:MFS transporter, DHA1 family, inner membrane transport protein
VTETSRSVLLSAAVLAFALLGDAFLYVALPVEAGRFGVSAAGVGLLLSANRLIRIVSYGAITSLAHRLGSRRLTLLAAVAATLSTIGYGLVQGIAPLLVLRLVWGLAFGALSLTTIVYAVEERERAGQRLGASRALIATGPLVALTLGPLLAGRWSSPGAFLVFGAMTALSIPLAVALPRRPSVHVVDSPPGLWSRWGFLGRRSFLTWWSLAIGFVVDGFFAVSFALLVAGFVSTSTALAATALVLATRYAAEIVLAPLAGRLSDRIGADRLLVRCTVLVAIGLLTMAAGAAANGFGGVLVADNPTPRFVPLAVWLGASIVVVARGLLLPLGPAVLAVRQRRHEDHWASYAYRDQGDLAAWRDTGAATGPLMAGWAAGVVPATGVYAGLAALLLFLLASADREAPRASFPGRLRLPG